MRCNESPHTIIALLVGVTVTVMAALPVGSIQDDDTSSVLGGAVLDRFLPADLNDNHNTHLQHRPRHFLAQRSYRPVRSPEVDEVRR